MVFKARQWDEISWGVSPGASQHSDVREMQMIQPKRQQKATVGEIQVSVASWKPSRESVFARRTE